MSALFPHAMPVMGWTGGILIGLSGAIMLLGLGRIAGVSGLAARALGFAAGGAPRWQAVAFILGLPLGAALIAEAHPVVTSFPDTPASLIIGGLLVGFGTRLGSGCTSGHGVCGLSRLSARSIVATGLFMAAGIATVAIARMAGIG